MNSNDIVKRINEVSNLTALANTDYDFLATHMPFKKLSYGTVGNSENLKEELTEENFLEKYIYPSRSEHKMIFIKGNSGSGKSHLIRWFYNKYKNKVDENEELIILISRDSNSLKGTLNQIVGSDLFKGFKEEAEFKKIIEAGKFLEEKKLKEDIPALLSSAVRTTTKIDISKRERNKIANFLSADIIREKVLFREGGPISRIITSMIGSNNEEKTKNEKGFLKVDFDIVDTKILREMRDTEGDMGASNRAISFAEDIERSDAKKQEVADTLNSLIDEVIKDIIGLGRTDLQDVFKKIRIKLKQKDMNLTIFFEDITTTTGIHKELIESLIVNHKEVEGLCRIISFVGITENYYLSQIQKNIEGRTNHILDIEESSLIENKQDLSTFIGLYMNAINQPKEKIEEWHLNYSQGQDLPISTLNKDKKWSVIKIDDEREVSIYPFTDDALWNIYQARDREGREPRGFLRLIINNIYSNYITDGVNYLLNMDVYNNTEIPKLKDPLDEGRIRMFSKGNEEIKKKIESLIRIWGDGSLVNRLENGTKTIGNVDEDIFNHFKLPKISGAIQPSLSVPPEILIQPRPQEPIPQTDRKKIGYERAFSQLEDWRKGGKLFEHKKYRDSILDLCKGFINWEEEGLSKYLIDTLLTSAVLNIEGQNVDTKSGITFERDDDLYFVLIGLVNWEYKGDRSWEFENSHKYILRITQYLNKHKESIMSLVQKPKGENWELEDILLINSYYFNLLNRRLKENLSIEELYLTLFNTSGVIVTDSDDKLDENWLILRNIYNKSQDLKLSQELLIKYFNLPQGIATAQISGNIEIYAYKIIEKIKTLNDLNWAIGNYKVKVERTIDIYKPVEFFRKEIFNKIPILLDEIGTNIEKLVENLESRYENELDERKIKSLSDNINLYLDTVVKTGFINNKETYDKIIYDTDEKLFYSIYKRSKKYNKLTDIGKLLYISKNDIETLYKYNINLIKLESGIEEYNKNCEANIATNLNENIDYKKMMEEVEETELEINLQIERYLR